MIPLSRAITIAVQAHDGQTDKAGQPYVLHPLRVMLAMETDDERIVAVLHDVIEDTAITDLDFPSRFVDALWALTRGPIVRGARVVPYSSYIDHIAKNHLATRVKIADLRDNLRPERAVSLTDSHRRRYEDALAKLQSICGICGTPEPCPRHWRGTEPVHAGCLPKLREEK